MRFVEQLVMTEYLRLTSVWKKLYYYEDNGCLHKPGRALGTGSDAVCIRQRALGLAVSSLRQAALARLSRQRLVPLAQADVMTTGTFESGSILSRNCLLRYKHVFIVRWNPLIAEISECSNVGIKSLQPGLF